MATTKVCVIGGGISGLGAAWLLSHRDDVEVTVFEERHQAGGHANTVEIDGFPVDTGFLVYNDITYPNLLNLFETIGVKSDPSDMSFSVSMHGRSMEWSSDLAGFLGTPANMVSPRFWQMVRDMMRFNNEAPKLLEREEGDEPTLGEFLEMGGYSAAFCDYYLFPMVACVWSATAEDVMAFPARTLIRFFVNHHLVSLDKPQWRTVSGRSRAYVDKISRRFRSRLFLNAPVKSVRRVRKASASEAAASTSAEPLSGGAFESVVELASGASRTFDHVIMACHPDQALSILGDGASAAERDVLGRFQYDPNVAYLHRDASLMPQRRACWTSWNFIGHGKLDESSVASAKAGAKEACCITYWLNRLQNFSAEDHGDVFVTLNPPHAPAEGSVLRVMRYAHPQYTTEAIRAQGRVDSELQGRRGTWFAGAYLGYGFHEDGLTSGLRAAFRLGGLAPPWWHTAPGVPKALPAHRPSPYEAEAYGAAAARTVAATGAAAVGVRASLDEAAAARGADRDAGCGYVLAPERPDGAGAASIGVFGLRVRESNAGDDSVSQGGLSTVALPEADPLADGLRRRRVSREGLALGDEAEEPASTDSQQRDDEDSSTDSRPSTEAVLPVPLPAQAAAAAPTAGTHGAAQPTAAAQAAGAPESEEPASPATGASGPEAASTRSSGASLSPASSKLPRAALGRAPPPRLIPMGPGGSFVEWHDPWRPGAASSQETRRGRGVAVEVVGAGGGGSCFGGFEDAAEEGVPGTIRFYRSKEWGLIHDAATSADASKGKGGGYSSLLAVKGPERTGGRAVAVGPATLDSEAAARSGTAAPRGWCSLSGWGGALAGAANWAAAAPVLALLRDGIKEGCVVLRTPAGMMHLFGNALAPAEMRAEIHVRDESFFFRVAAEADVGLARAYIAGQWACDDLAALFRIFIANRDRSGSGFASGALWTATVGRLLNVASYSLFLDNTIAGSRANIHAHYDLSNALFETFLDPTTMAYSCGRFRVDGVDAATGKPRFGGSLDEAQVRKLDELIRLADVRPGQRLLDIGCGWGGLAIRLAQTRGCSVVGITLSTEQKQWAEKRVRALGLEERVSFELVDYRTFAKDNAGQFDRIITVEMVEAVGHSHLGEFMGACGRLLKPSGLMVMQAITMPEPRYEEYKRSADFINTIIFPGGHCPCVTSLSEAMARCSDMTLEHVQNHALHYAETLRVWQRNFNAHLDRVHELGFDAAFVRMWNYYLAYCEAGFETQTLGLHALLFAKPAALAQF